METKRGGKRIGAGRKPIAEKKVAITIYVKGSTILNIGSIETTKEYIYGNLENYSENASVDLNRSISPLISYSKSERVDQWQEPKKVLVRSFEQYNQLKLDCENQEDWSLLSEEIRNSSLSTKQKSFLLN